MCTCSGWGATSLVHHLKREAFDVTVVSPRNAFLMVRRHTCAFLTTHT